MAGLRRGWWLGVRLPEKLLESTPVLGGRRFLRAGNFLPGLRCYLR
jgi:hypothetical protein